MLRKLTQGWSVGEVNRVLSEHRRRPHLCSYNLLFQYAERAKERGDIEEEIEFRRALFEMSPDRIDVLVNFAAALNRGRAYNEEIRVREEIEKLLSERQITGGTRNSTLLMKARALQARRNLSPKDREPKKRDY